MAVRSMSARTMRASVRRMRRNGRISPPLNDEKLTVDISESEMDFCCGVDILGEAKCCNDGLIEAASLRYANAFTKRLFEVTNKNNTRSGLALYTTAASQKLEKVALKKAGFVVVATFRNPNSGNWLQLHAKLLNQPARRARAARRGTVRRTSRR